MIYMFIGILLGVFFFIATIKAYTIGLKHGKALRHDSIPAVKTNPIKAYKEHVEAQEEKKQNDDVMEGLRNILAYDGTPQVEEKR